MKVIVCICDRCGDLRLHQEAKDDRREFMADAKCLRCGGALRDAGTTTLEGVE